MLESKGRRPQAQPPADVYVFAAHLVSSYLSLLPVDASAVPYPCAFSACFGRLGRAWRSSAAPPAPAGMP